jgi:hypothetical protein
VEDDMECNTDWVTLGKHRVRLRSGHGFPTETLRMVAEVVKLAIENNMSARARLVEVVLREEGNAYDINVGTTLADDKICATQVEVSLATVFGLAPAQLTLTVTTVSQAEVDLHFGIYERLLAQKLEAVPPTQ